MEPKIKTCILRKAKINGDAYLLKIEKRNIWEISIFTKELNLIYFNLVYSLNPSCCMLVTSCCLHVLTYADKNKKLHTIYLRSCISLTENNAQRIFCEINLCIILSL